MEHNNICPEKKEEDRGETFHLALDFFCLSSRKISLTRTAEGRLGYSHRAGYGDRQTDQERRDFFALSLSTDVAAAALYWSVKAFILTLNKKNPLISAAYGFTLSSFL